MLNLVTLLEDSAREYPDKTAVVSGDTRLTFGELNESACRVANGLVAVGIRAGEKVALTCANSSYFPMAYYGILKMGGVVVPLNVLLKSREISYHLNDSDAAAFLCFEGTGAFPSAEESWSAFGKASSCRRFWLRRKDEDPEPPISAAATWEVLVDDQPAVFDTVQAQADDTSVIIYTSGTTGPAPELGEDTTEVLGDPGYTEQQIQDLLDQGAVVQYRAT
jgi:long-chain acyl-CoA synthetase